MNCTNELTPREREVLALVVEGKRNREIAGELTISPATVENHLHRIFGKLGVSTRTGAAMSALRRGMLANSEHPHTHYGTTL